MTALAFALQEVLAKRKFSFDSEQLNAPLRSVIAVHILTRIKEKPRVCTKQMEQTVTWLPGAFCIKLVSFSTKVVSQ